MIDYTLDTCSPSSHLYLFSIGNESLCMNILQNNHNYQDYDYFINHPNSYQQFLKYNDHTLYNQYLFDRSITDSSLFDYPLYYQIYLLLYKQSMNIFTNFIKFDFLNN